MNRELARKVADAALYEGYMLYPYRRSALKNRQRWSFGILYPPDYAEVQAGTERCSMHFECILETDGETRVQLELRFLHLATHQAAHWAEVDEMNSLQTFSEKSWDEGIERAVEFELNAGRPREEFQFGFPGIVEEDPQHVIGQRGHGTRSTQHSLTGAVSMFTEQIRQGVLKLSVDIKNTTPLVCDSKDRESALMRSMLSSNVILCAPGAHFQSLLDPPHDLVEAARACTNLGAFPVLIGEPGERDMLLCSPIILYDYPRIAPESAHDFYDATEMDEMLTLRLLTLTEQEKIQVKSGEHRVRSLLEQTEANAREQLMKTHGAIRGVRPVKEKHNE